MSRRQEQPRDNPLPYFYRNEIHGNGLPSAVAVNNGPGHQLRSTMTLKPQSREALTTNVLVLPGTILDENQTSVAEALTTKWLGKELLNSLTPQIFGMLRGPKVFGLHFFREYDGWHTTYMPMQSHKLVSGNTYKQHNIALKYVRDKSEAHGCSCVLFSNDVPFLVPLFVHEGGADYHFVGKPIFPWHWKEMVAQMDDRSQEVVVHAGQTNVAGRSRGIVHCSLQQLDIYDHKRSYVAQGEQRFHKVWYFVLECEDGTCVFLHPSYNRRKIECCKVEPEQDHREILGTLCPGTFKRFTTHRNRECLYFDSEKKRNHGQQTWRGIASSSS